VIYSCQKAGGPVIFLPFGAMGLGPGDDVDGLLFDPQIPPHFSLAPGSPSLGPFSPADAFVGNVGNVFLGPSNNTLGLAFKDNVDAFSDSPVPIPPASGSSAPVLLALWA
jgi:hypothetical protein